MTSPAVVARFVKASVFYSVNSAPSANGGSNPAWVWYILIAQKWKHCVAIQIAGRRGAAMPLRYMPQALTVNQWKL